MQTWVRVFGLALVIAGGWVILPKVALAACSAQDLPGSWTISAVQLSGAGAFVTKCEMSVNARGRISGTCVNRAPGQAWRGQLSGSARINRACAVGGRVGQDGVRAPFQARLDRAKNVLTGISYNARVVLQFTAVRR